MVRAHGESGALALAYPLTIDGLIYAASMVLLSVARQRQQAHWLAYGALGLGIAATLAVNVAAGLAYGLVGALVAAWPAPALVISYELLMLVIRTSVRTAPAPDARVLEPPAALNGQGHQAAELFAGDLANGTVPGIRRIREQMHVGQPRAQEIREYLSGLTNGHVPAAEGR